MPSSWLKARFATANAHDRSSARRHRTIIANALDYAKELGAIDVGANPIRALKWKAPVALATVDRRSVVNPRQARSLLSTVRSQKPSGPRLVAFFGTIYFAALRPEEVISLGKQNVTLPPHVWNAETEEWEDPPGSDGWGEFEFGDASPDAGRRWTDDGDQRDRRQLKHHPKGDTRTAPICPELAKLLRWHTRNSATCPTESCSPASWAASCLTSPSGARGPPPAARR